MIGIVRAERAVVAAYAFPENAFEAVVVSEVVGAVAPLLVNTRTLAPFALAVARVPRYASAVLDLYAKKRSVPLQCEACALLLVLCSMMLAYS